jgi:hypothetical protein
MFEICYNNVIEALNAKENVEDIKDEKIPSAEELYKNIIMVLPLNDLPSDEGVVCLKKENGEIPSDFVHHWSAGNFSQKPTKYAILEPLDAVKDRFIGGDLETKTFLTVGDYKISDRAIILVPKNEAKEILKKHPNLKKYMQTYNSEKNTIDHYIHKYLAKEYWLIKKGENDSEIEINDKKFKFSSFFKNWMDSQKIKFFKYQDHPLEKISKSLKIVFEGLSSAQQEKSDDTSLNEIASFAFITSVLKEAYPDIKKYLEEIKKESWFKKANIDLLVNEISTWFDATFQKYNKKLEDWYKKFEKEI